jgi:hypothetical protein
MNIVLVTLAVIVAMCVLFVFCLFTQAGCKAALEPELLVFDEPLTGGADCADGEEPIKQRVAGEPA